MPSASPLIARGAVVASCLALLGAGAAGCSTTQEKAEHQAARAHHILKARAERQKAKKKKHDKDHHKHSEGNK